MLTSRRCWRTYVPLNPDLDPSFAQINLIRAGATSMCVIWGPLVGARVLSYQAALLLQIACHLVGNMVFGPLELLPYSGIIKSTTRASFVPEFVIYALLCVTATLQFWHLLAFWRKVPVSPFAALGEQAVHQQLILPAVANTKPCAFQCSQQSSRHSIDLSWSKLN